MNSVSTSIDAAHLEGRSWRKGDNTAADGVLLRRDLHALYDKGLLTFLEAGVVQLHPEARDHYVAYEGVKASTPAPVND